MEIVFLSDVLSEIVTQGLQDDSLNRAIGEQRAKLRKAYHIFDIELDTFKVKGKYHINKQYANDIKWIVYYTSNYSNRDIDIRENMGIIKESMEAFLNREFQNVRVQDLEKIVGHMVNSLLAFNTEKLTDKQKVYLNEVINDIYTLTRLHYRKLEYQVQTQFNKATLMVDDKVLVYRYLIEIINKVGDFTKQIINDISDYREAEQITTLEEYQEKEAVVTRERVESLVVNSSIDILKDIIEEIEQSKQEENKIEIETDVQEWLREIANNKVSNYNQTTRYIDMRSRLEHNKKYLQEKNSYLKEEVKRKHYTSKKVKSIKQEIKENEAKILQIDTELKSIK